MEYWEISSSYRLWFHKEPKKLSKTSEGLPVPLTVVIPETQNNTEDRRSVDNTVEMKKVVTQHRQIPGQH